MNPEELLRLVDSIHRDRGIDREILFESIEAGILSAARKRYPERDVQVTVARDSGRITAMLDGEEIDPVILGRIAAQSAKQVIIQRLREAECDVQYDEYIGKVGTLITGTVQRFERGDIVVNLGKTEGVLPRKEQVFNESYHPGDQIRALIVDVRKKGQKAVITLSRTHPNLVKELFVQEVPEIAERIIEVKGVAREAGHRTKIAVVSSDFKVDSIGACVGVRGSRIRNIVDELNGEKIDIVRWNESPEIYVRSSLSPAEIANVEFDKDTRRARVIVPKEQLSLAIGRKGQNVRLSAKLTKWNIDIITDEESQKTDGQISASARVDTEEETDLTLPISPDLWEKVQAAGIDSVEGILAAGVEGLTKVEGISPEKAQEILDQAKRLFT